MSKKLFVGSLSWGTNDDALRDAFAVHGEITEAVVISDRDTGRSRGFGFVTFEDDEAADKAVAALNGTELDGRTIRVDVAQAKERNRGAGAAVLSRIKTIVYGAKDPKFGACGSIFEIPTEKKLNHRIEVIGGIMESEVAELMRLFFRQVRQKKEGIN